MTVCSLLVFPSGAGRAGQADSDQTAETLRQRMTEQEEQLARMNARQNQKIFELREQEIPRLRGEIEKTLRLARALQAKQEDLTYRSGRLEERVKILEGSNGAPGSPLTQELGSLVNDLSARMKRYEEILGLLVTQIGDLSKRLAVLEKQ